MPMKQRCGVLVYNKERDRIDIRFDLNNYYGGLHCGQCFDVMVGGRWVPTRIEMASTWYLVGIQTDSRTLCDIDSLCLTDRNTSEPDGFLSVSNTAADCWISYT